MAPLACVVCAGGGMYTLGGRGVMRYNRIEKQSIVMLDNERTFRLSETTQNRSDVVPDLVTCDLKSSNSPYAAGFVKFTNDPNLVTLAFLRYPHRSIYMFQSLLIYIYIISLNKISISSLPARSQLLLSIVDLRG